MYKPLFERGELFNIGRTLGALLVIFGGLALILQAYFVELIPPRNGFVTSQATVLDLEQTGSFQEPGFMVTLEYSVEHESSDTIRSARRVAFEQYYDLAIGQVINIHYNPDNVAQWRIDSLNNELNQYGLGFLMIIFGVLSLSFPILISWASRQEDFEFTDELDDDVVSGANPY